MNTRLVAFLLSLAPLSACHSSDSDSDADPLGSGTVQFSSTAYSVNEAVGSATITVTRTGGAAGKISVVCLAGGGAATPGADYPQFYDYVQELVWEDGDASPKSFDVPILEDTAVEGTEDLNLTLTGSSGIAPIGNPGTSILNVIDND